MPVLVFSPNAFVLRDPNYRIAAHPSAISLKWFCLQYLTAGRRDIERGSLSVRKILPSGRKHSELSSFVAMKQIIPVSFSQFSVPELMDFIRRILTEDREALFFTYALKIPPFLRADDLKRNIPFRESLFQSRRISPVKLPYFREFRTCIREDQTHRTLQRIFPVGLADKISWDLYPNPSMASLHLLIFTYMLPISSINRDNIKQDRSSINIHLTTPALPYLY